MVRNDVGFLRHDADHQVAANRPDQWIAKLKSAVGAIAMQPKRAVAAHDDHAVHESEGKEANAQVLGHKNHEWNRQKERGRPAKEREPIFGRVPDFHLVEELGENLTMGGTVKCGVFASGVAVTGWF